MCRIYSATDPSEYEQIARSVRLRGHATSVRLERRFWAVLEELAEREGYESLGKLLATLHDEALGHHGRVTNFASLLRVVCTTYLAHQAPDFAVRRWLTASEREPEPAPRADPPGA